VVHFIGAMKPWHYEYDTTTCQLKETGTVSPHLLQMWWDIFLAFVNPRLSRHMPGLVGQLAMLQVHWLAAQYSLDATSHDIKLLLFRDLLLRSYVYRCGLEW